MSAEFLALQSEIRFGLDRARALVTTCKTTQPLFSTSCRHVACYTGNNTEILRQIFFRLNFFAHELVVQLEEVDTTLVLLQERVGQLTRGSVSEMGTNEGFTNQDGFGLKYGIQKLCEHQLRASPFLSHYDDPLFKL